MREVQQQKAMLSLDEGQRQSICSVFLKCCHVLSDDCSCSTSVPGGLVLPLVYTIFSSVDLRINYIPVNQEKEETLAQSSLSTGEM